MQKHKPIRSGKHLAFIRTLPCCVCANPIPSEAAHIRIGNDGGVGMKPGDNHVVPMCHACHAELGLQMPLASFYGLEAA